jgi:hypothetical protein
MTEAAPSPDLVAAIAAADEAGFDVIMVDSCSHEYEGEGGLHEMHDAAVALAVEKARASHNESWGAFDENRAADRASIGAWREPKMRHKKFVSRLLQCRAHLILCMRADAKIRIEKVKDERGRERTVIVQPKEMRPVERWVPICEKRFMYEMTISFVLTPEAPGVPVPIKLQAQHRSAVPLDRPLDEATGRALAQWAMGGSAERPSRRRLESPAPEPPAPSSAAGERSGAGAAPIPSAEDYAQQWQAICEQASDPDELNRLWTSDRHKKLRNAILWPDDESHWSHWRTIRKQVSATAARLRT